MRSLRGRDEKSRKMHVHPCRMFFPGPSSFMVVAAAQVVVGLEESCVVKNRTQLFWDGDPVFFSSEKMLSL